MGGSLRFTDIADGRYQQQTARTDQQTDTMRMRMEWRSDKSRVVVDGNAKICMNGAQLEKTYSFTYLGASFARDGSSMACQDVVQQDHQLCYQVQSVRVSLGSNPAVRM